eukprot:277125-Ditylum_brightwellii.AAC.1
MIIDYFIKGKLQVDMKYYLEAMIKDFPYKIKSTKTATWSENMFKVCSEAKLLDSETAIFAVHPDMKSCTGALFTMGKGAIYRASTKQK